MKRVGAILAVLLIVLELCSDNIQARPTTEKEAEKVVNGWLKASPRPLGTALGQQVTEIQTYTDDGGSPLYYIVYLQPNGFVIVSADDLIEPIIGFAEDGIYDPSPTNPLGALVTGDLNGRIRSVRTGQPVRTKAVTNLSIEPQSKWNKFICLAEASEKEVGTMGLSGINDVRVAPLIQTKWFQKNICSGTLACYNYYTPGPTNNWQGTEGDTTNYWCGCVATALAQIMRYHQWPNTGVGNTTNFSIKIWDTIYTRHTRGGDGNGGAYNWAQMPLAPDSICSTITEAQRQAIGALCYDAGVGISHLASDAYNPVQYTRYTYDETDAYTHSAKKGLIDTFKYGNAIYGFNSGNNISAGLIGMVNPNLDAGLPVYFGIKKGTAGHAVVCDGYGYNAVNNAVTMYHHLNMGWAGLSDAWYNLPTIDSSPSYDTLCETIYNIYPLGDGEVISGRVTDPGGNPISNVKVSEFVYPGPSFTNICYTNAKGIYHFDGPASDTNLAVWAEKTGYVFGGYKVVRTGKSIDSNSTSGNVWGVNFVCIPPDVNTIAPTSGPRGTYMKIQGAHFGASQGTVILPGVGYFGEILHYATTYSETVAGTVIVKPGIYNENINLGSDWGIWGITLTSTDPNDSNIVASTVINGGGNGAVVTFNNDWSVLTGFTITNGYTDGYGGGICCNWQCEGMSPTISHCLITGNSAGEGGGIYCYDSSPTISHCIIAGNWAYVGGGGIDCNNEWVGFSPTISHCLIVGNSAWYGGGIFSTGGSPTIGHCDISSNNTGGGGGILCAGGNMIVHHTILWADTAPYGPEIAIVSPSVLTIGYSDVQGGLTGVYQMGGTLHWDANNIINADPMFVRDPNPGPDGQWDGVNDDFGDLHLRSISPCIDAGDP
ncbi:MAG: C10 family peptidase, partial [Planctomycetota bacterium]|nr:C10 family peptidase [Planctomycetota bacterium]